MSSVSSTPIVYEKPVHPKAPMSFRHNVVPPLLGIGMMLSVFGLMNSQLLVAQATYRMHRPATNAVAVPQAAVPSKESVKLTIPTIAVEAPVVYDEKSYEEPKVQLALRRGVVHYGTTALPGQAGNVVLLGHSSGQAWAPGDYKFVFTMLDKLEKNDRVFLEYKGVRYIYRVTGKTVVEPTDLSVVQHTPKPQLTLITCTPVGTNKNRLVVTAEQIVPNPRTATHVADETTRPVTTGALPR